MISFTFPNSFFNIKDSLECGQIFRFSPFEKGFLVFSLDKCAYCYEQGDFVVIECEDADKPYFERFFDLENDYSLIVDGALSFGVDILSRAATLGKGVRIFNQDPLETLFSFIISQNNNIPRIKGIIERLCASLGESKSFMGVKYYAFPTARKMAEQGVDFFKSIGLGYRAEYVHKLAVDVDLGLDVYSFNAFDTPTLKARLTALYGVGPKVCDCVSLFGFHRTDSFPVDTWIDKVYRENFNGTLTNRVKVAEWFVNRFGKRSGYYQQYLFYYKRSLENKA